MIMNKKYIPLILAAASVLAPFAMTEILLGDAMAFIGADGTMENFFKYFGCFFAIYILLKGYVEN